MSQAGLNSFSGTAGAITFVTDSGSATPSGGNLNVNGAGGSSTSGSGNTIVVTSTSDFFPNKTIQEFDDFIGLDSTALSFSKLGWDFNGAGVKSTSAANPGQFIFDTNKTNYLSLDQGNLSNGFLIVGGGTFVMNWVFNLVALANVTNNYTTYIGLTDNVNNFGPTNAPPDNGIYFQYNYNVNGGNWQLICSDGTATTVNTSVAASTGFHNYAISINAAGTSVSFTIDGVSAGSAITTHIPATALTPTIYSINQAGSLPAQAVDLFYYTQTLTAAR